MLRTIVVRSILVILVLCLVSAARPTAKRVYDDPTEARLDVAKTRVEMVAPSRRDSRDPRDQRALALGLPSLPFALVAPPRTALVLEQRAVVFAPVSLPVARSSRGPPVG